MRQVRMTAEVARVRLAPAEACKPTEAEFATIKENFGWLALALMAALQLRGFVFRSCWTHEPANVTPAFLEDMNEDLKGYHLNLRVEMSRTHIWFTRPPGLGHTIH